MSKQKPLTNYLLLAFLLLTNIIGGSVIADNYLSIKGNEVNVITTTATTGDQANGNTSIDRVAGLYVTNQAEGLLSVEATKDINLQGAVISNEARAGTTQLVAKEGSVNIGTVTVAHNESTGDAQHFYNERTTTEVGSNINVVNKLLVKAGDNVNIIGSDLNSQLGDVVIHATVLVKQWQRCE